MHSHHSWPGWVLLLLVVMDSGSSGSTFTKLKRMVNNHGIWWYTENREPPLRIISNRHTDTCIHFCWCELTCDDAYRIEMTLWRRAAYQQFRISFRSAWYAGTQCSYDVKKQKHIQYSKTKTNFQPWNLSPHAYLAIQARCGRVDAFLEPALADRDVEGAIHAPVRAPAVEGHPVGCAVIGAYSPSHHLRQMRRKLFFVAVMSEGMCAGASCFINIGKCVIYMFVLCSLEWSS